MHGADHYDTLTGINNLASCYYALNQLDKARPLMQEAYDLRRERLGTDHPHTIISTTNLAVVIEKAGDGKAALPLFEAALAASEKKNGKHHPDTVLRVRNLANCVRDLGDTDRAMILYRDYADRQGTAEGKDSLAYAHSLIYFGFNQLELKRWAEAEPVLRTCLEIREKKQPDAWGTFNTMSLLGGSLLGQKKYAEAEPLLRKGYEGLMQRVKLLPSPNAFYFRPGPRSADRPLHCAEQAGRSEEVEGGAGEVSDAQGSRPAAAREKVSRLGGPSVARRRARRCSAESRLTEDARSTFAGRVPCNRPHSDCDI